MIDGQGSGTAWLRGTQKKGGKGLMEMSKTHQRGALTLHGASETQEADPMCRLLVAFQSLTIHEPTPAWRAVADGTASPFEGV